MDNELEITEEELNKIITHSPNCKSSPVVNVRNPKLIGMLLAPRLACGFSAKVCVQPRQ
jgi:hypothetical protein